MVIGAVLRRPDEMIESRVDADPELPATHTQRSDARQKRARLRDEIGPRLEDRGEIARTQEPVSDARQLGAVLIDRELWRARLVRHRNPATEVQPSKIRKRSGEIEQAP